MNKRLILLGIILGLLVSLFLVKKAIAPVAQQPQWKSYTNSQYGFTLSVPTDWQTEEWDIKEAANLTNVPDGTILYQGKFFGKEGHFEVLVWENKSKVSVRQWLTWYRHEDLILADVPAKENFNLVGIPALRYLQQTTARKKPLLYIFFSKDDRLYELTEERNDLAGIEATASSQLTSPVYDQILNSFQFVVQ